MLHYQPKKSKKNGFSLIELLVVVAIIGVLAAVAIPAYNNYRVNAAQASLTSSLNNIGKGFAACLTLKSFNSCKSVDDIGVSCSQCQNSGGAGGRFCTDAFVNVGGRSYNGCVESTGGVHSVFGNWPIPCRELSAPYTCTSGNYVAPAGTCASLGCSASAAVPSGACSADAVHSCTTANQDDLSNGTQFAGTCNPSTGECT